MGPVGPRNAPRLRTGQAQADPLPLHLRHITLAHHLSSLKETPMSEPKQENVIPMGGRLVKQNSTHGQPLPPNLQHELEVRSGASLDGYRVHYRSALPSHLDAVAYTRGTDIHIGFGQENHLPHEAWHVVQQKQQGGEQGTTLRQALRSTGVPRRRNSAALKTRDRSPWRGTPRPRGTSRTTTTDD